VSERLELEMNPWPPFRQLLRQSLWVTPVAFVIYVVWFGLWDGVLLLVIVIVGTPLFAYLMARYRQYIVLHKEWLNLKGPRRRTKIRYSIIEFVDFDVKRGTLTIRWFEPTGHGFRKHEPTLWPKDPEAAAAEILRRIELAKAERSAGVS
jgi:hypothetical protein